MDILKKIKEQEYISIFWVPDKQLLDQLWSGGENKKDLQDIWTNGGLDLKTRLIAAEILFSKDDSFPGTIKKTKTLLARLYADVLANSGTINGNIWGLPGEIGETGSHFLKTDRDEVVHALKSLLDNIKRLSYTGSKQATVGNGYLYRVKDIAAFYLSRIFDLPYTIYQTPDQRDTEINELIKRLTVVENSSKKST